MPATVIVNCGRSKRFHLSLLLGIYMCSSFASGANYAYVSNAQSAAVAVIDTSTQAVVATIPVPYPDPEMMVLSPDGSRLYVVLTASSGVAVIDTALRVTIATVPVGTQPRGIVITPDGSHVYVSSGCNTTACGGFTQPAVSVIDTSTNQISAQIDLSGACTPCGLEGLAISPLGNRVYVDFIEDSAHFGGVATIDTSTNTLTGSPIYTLKQGCCIAVSPDGTTLYLSNEGDSSFSIVNLNSTVVTNIALSPSCITPWGMAVMPDNSRVYLACYDSASVVAVNPATAAIAASITGFPGVSALPALTPDATQLYVPDRNVPVIGSNSVTVVNTSTNTISATFPSGGFAPEAVLIASSSFSAQIQQPINADGSSVFSSSRGSIPVKFILTSNGAATCQLPPAAISLERTSGSAPGSLNESDFMLPSDSGANFRISDCQYVYNLAASSLGPGTYQVRILINGFAAGAAVFGLR
jgi:YVTN family beta-propeller protein